MKKYLLALFLGLYAMLPTQVFALGTTTCQDYNQSIPGAAGSLSMAGELCVTVNFDLTNPSAGSSNTVEGNGDATFSNYTPVGSEVPFVANGTFQISYTAQADSAGNGTFSITYNGGPVTYTIANQTYEVVYQQLSFSFSMTAGSVPVMTSYSGGVTINGQYLGADETLYEYVSFI